MQNQHDAADERRIGGVFDLALQKMQLEFKESALTVHKAAKGEARELILREFLAQHLSKNVEVIHKTEIIDTCECVSNECDVTVVDWRTPRFYSAQGDGIRTVPIECVHGVIEVKSKLDTKELDDAVLKLSNVKSFPKRAIADFEDDETTARRYPTIGLIFAYESIDLKILRARLEQLSAVRPPEHSVDIVCVLDRGIIIRWNEQAAVPSLASTHDEGDGYQIFDFPNPLAVTVVLLQAIFGKLESPHVLLAHYVPDFRWREAIRERGPESSGTGQAAQPNG